jgi:hypothetical protein
MRERSILPFTVAELVTRSRTGDEDDQMTLMVAPPAHGIETGIGERCKETSVLVFLQHLPGPLL